MRYKKTNTTDHENYFDRLADIVKILGTAISKPELPWVQFSDEDAFSGMKAAGMSTAVASVYVEMGTAIRNGILWEDYDKVKPVQPGNSRFEDFAKEFAAVYNS